MTSLKSQSRYLTDEVLSIIYDFVQDEDAMNQALVTILHRTGIRIGELKSYVQACLATSARPIFLDPLKNNRQRVIPNLLVFMPTLRPAFVDLAARGTDTYRKRIAFMSRRFDIAFSPHDFRATFITNALRRGVEPPLLMILTGHRAIGSLMRYNRLSTAHELYLYDFITRPFAEYETSEDLFVLKRKLRALERTNARLRARMRPKKRF